VILKRRFEVKTIKLFGSALLNSAAGLAFIFSGPALAESQQNGSVRSAEQPSARSTNKQEIENIKKKGLARLRLKLKTAVSSALATASQSLGADTERQQAPDEPVSSGEKQESPPYSPPVVQESSESPTPSPDRHSHSQNS
jgi:hypothetical protein